MDRLIIAPSILSADFTCLGKQISEAESAGAGWIHIDVMDGHFVPNLTMGPFIVEACRRCTKLPLNVHMMVDNPEDMLEAFASSGADHLIIHVETCQDVVKIAGKIKKLGCKVGFVLNPSTPVWSLDEAIHVADLILVLTVNPGYSHQEFMPEVLPKIVDIRQNLDKIGSRAWLEVDGGISSHNIASVRDAGADAFVAASAIFLNPGGIADGIQSLKNALKYQT